MRFEIVRTAHSQWHWRIVASNGRILASSENYRRKVGCERAIEALASQRIVLSPFAEHPEIRWPPNRDTLIAEVRYIDDRLKPMPRPELPDPGSLS